MKQDLENKVFARAWKNQPQPLPGWMQESMTGHDASDPILTARTGLNSSNIMLSRAIPATYTSAASIK